LTSTGGPGPLDASFTAAIRKDGAFATYLELDGSTRCSAPAARSRSPARSTAIVRGDPHAVGQRPHWLPLRAALCKAIGKADRG
jgi:hypothetical protein